jgi:hypothetical protein
LESANYIVRGFGAVPIDRIDAHTMTIGVHNIWTGSMQGKRWSGWERRG